MRHTRIITYTSNYGQPEIKCISKLQHHPISHSVSATVPKHLQTRRYFRPTLQYSTFKTSIAFWWLRKRTVTYHYISSQATRARIHQECYAVARIRRPWYNKLAVDCVHANLALDALVMSGATDLLQPTLELPHSQTPVTGCYIQLPWTRSCQPIWPRT